MGSETGTLENLGPAEPDMPEKALTKNHLCLREKMT